MNAPRKSVESCQLIVERTLQRVNSWGVTMLVAKIMFFISLG